MRKRSLLIISLVFGIVNLTSYSLAEWSPPQRLTWNSGYSSDPVIAADSKFNVIKGCNIHIVWTDNTPGNCEIYYKKGK